MPEVKKLLQGRFEARFPSAGMTTYTMTRLLELLPVMHLATTPLDNVDASREIQSTLTSVGYYEALPKSKDGVKPDTVEKIAGLIDNAQERFPFDLTPLALEGQRPLVS